MERSFRQGESFEDKFPRLDCRKMFRFEAREIDVLSQRLLPRDIKTTSRKVCAAHKALCLVLYRLAWPHRWHEAIPLFAKSEAWLSEVFHKTLSLLNEFAEAALRSFDEEMLEESYEDLVNLRFREVGSIECWGTVDGTLIQVSKPTFGETEFYSGYKKKHCICALIVHLWNGLIFYVSPPSVGRKSDATLCQDDALQAKFAAVNDQLQQNLNLEVRPCVVGDSGFAASSEILTPWNRQGPNRDINLRARQELFNYILCTLVSYVFGFSHFTANQRIGSEWGIGYVKKKWKGLKFPDQIQVLRSRPEKMMLVSCLLTNFAICAYGCQHLYSYKRDLPQFEWYLNRVCTRKQGQLNN